MMSTSRQNCCQTEARKNLNRLRHHAPEKLRSLTTMHLSILLDLDGDKLEALSGEDRPTSSTPFARKRSNDKMSLTQELVNQMHKLIKYLNKTEYLKVEGLFRKSGNVARQRQLRQWLESERAAGPVAVDEAGVLFTPHDCATVLKTLLSEMPEPLLTDRHVEAHRQIAALGTKWTLEADRDRVTKRRIRALQLLFLLLPQNNAILVEFLLHLLSEVTRLPENRMTSEALGTIFAPHFLCSRKLTPAELHEASGQFSPAVAFMVEHAEELFKIPEILAMDVNQYWKKLGTPENLSTESTDSPRRVVEDNKDLSSQLAEMHVADKADEEASPSMLAKTLVKWDSGPALTSVVCYSKRKSTEELEADSKRETEKQLANLYNHILAMPKSAEKKKLMHRFNKTNNNSEGKKKHSRSRTFGESVMKHLRSMSKSRFNNSDDCKKSLTQDLDAAAGKESKWAFANARASTSVETVVASPSTGTSAGHRSPSTPVWRLQSPVHIVNMSSSSRQSRPRKRRSDEDLVPARPNKAPSLEDTPPSTRNESPKWRSRSALPSAENNAPKMRGKPSLPSVENEIPKLRVKSTLPSTENEIPKLRVKPSLPSTDNEIVYLRAKYQMRAGLLQTPLLPSKLQRPKSTASVAPSTPQSDASMSLTRSPLVRVNSGFHESSL